MLEDFGVPPRLAERVEGSKKLDLWFRESVIQYISITLGYSRHKTDWLSCVDGYGRPLRWVRLVVKPFHGDTRVVCGSQLVG